MAEFVFVDARLKAPLRVGATNKDIDADGGLGWWRFDGSEKEVLGWRESIAQIKGVIEEQGPFDGMLGFSQGASMTALALPA